MGTPLYNRDFIMSSAIDDPSAAKGGGKKRRKTSPTPPPSNIQHLTQLPTDQLVHIADYLPKTSRALFAVALTAPSVSWCASGFRGEPSEVSSAIIMAASSSKKFYLPENDGTGFYRKKGSGAGVVSVTGVNGDDMEFHPNKSAESEIKEYYAATSWAMLSLVDLELHLAKKMKDDDIGAILVCINATENLKKLRIASPYGDDIVGHGLEPLRGSAVLKSITIGDQSYDWRRNQSQEKPLSVGVVIPILNSILDAGNSLREVSLPSKWKMTESRNDPPLSDFFGRFSQLKITELVECVHCSRTVEGTNENSCLLCHRRSCANCDRLMEEDEEEWYGPYESPFIKSCDHCSQSLCNSCGSHGICSKCNSMHCSVCTEIDGIDAGKYCEDIDCRQDSLCLGCRVPGEANGCWGCHHISFPKLLAEKERATHGLTVLAEENGRLADENDQLRKEIEDLKLVPPQLRDDF